MVYSGMKKYIPTRSIIIGRSKYPKWFDRKLINLINVKRNVHSKYMETGDIDDYQLFSSIRSDCKRRSDELYNRYMRSV